MTDVGSRGGIGTVEGRHVGLVSVSLDLGAGRRGVDMGPSALRIAGVVDAIEALGYPVEEGGTVTAPGPEVAEEGEASAKYLEAIAEVCAESAYLVRTVLSRGAFPLVLGGDHSLTMGTAAAMSDHYREQGESLGLIWVDAHTDMNTPETSPSGNIHGMSLSVLTGHGPAALVGLAGAAPAFDPAHVSVIGARQIDPGEREAIAALGIRVFTMSEVDERGLAQCIDEAMERANQGTAGFHMSFDLDVLEPMVAPGVGTPVAGGLTYREGHLVCEKAARSGRLRGFELVELNPVLDDSNRTGRVGIGLIESALGKRIL